MSLFTPKDFYDPKEDNSVQVDGVYIFFNKRDRALQKMFAVFAAQKASIITAQFIKGLPTYGPGQLEIPVGFEARVIMTPIGNFEIATGLPTTESPEPPAEPSPPAA